MYLHILKCFGIQPKRKFYLVCKTDLYRLQPLLKCCVFVPFCLYNSEKQKRLMLQPLCPYSEKCPIMRSALPSAVSVSGFQPRNFNLQNDGLVILYGFFHLYVRHRVSPPSRTTAPQTACSLSVVSFPDRRHKTAHRAFLRVMGANCHPYHTSDNQCRQTLPSLSICRLQQDLS